MNIPKTYVTALTIAGSDPSGGAGIQADLKTFSALGCYGMSVITALTAQNTQGVLAVHPIPTAFIGQQLDAVFADIEVDAIKIGMLHNVEVIEVVTEKLQQWAKNISVVLDPVMASQSGHKLLNGDAIKALPQLFSLATLITPNIPEAELLLQREIKDMEQAAQKLGKDTSVLIKGGHGNGDESKDCFYDKVNNKIHWLSSKRIKTKNLHGTGCTLSSAITSFLALENDLVSAVTKAKKYITTAILSGSQYQLGHGNGPVDHFYVPELFT